MTDKVKKLKESYPPGTRLELLHMNDPYAPVPDGTRGTVKLVDDRRTERGLQYGNVRR